jgi:putative ABC transport system permease protein
MVADFMVEPTGMVMYGYGVSSELAERLRGTPGVGVVSEVRYGQWGLQGKAQQLAGVDPATFPRIVELDADSRASLGELTDLSVLIDPDVAQEHGWKIGEQIPMQFTNSGTQDMTIAGFFESEGWTPNYLITLASYERNYAQQMDTLVGVRRAAGWTAAEARAQIDRVLEAFPSVKLEDKQEFTRSRMKMVDSLLAFITALLLLSVLIALLGIANTLAMSMYERTRELGLLRAVGMSRRQLRSMVRWEAVIIGVIGALLGLGIGVFFGWTLVRAMRDQGVSEFALPVVRLVTYVLLAALAGVVASLLPARRAAKLNILEAIAFE